MDSQGIEGNKSKRLKLQWSCWIPECSSQQYAADIGSCSFFSFPTDRRRKKMWIKQCERAFKKRVARLTPADRICERHFLRGSYAVQRNTRPDRVRRKQLKSYAVPILFFPDDIIREHGPPRAPAASSADDPGTAIARTAATRKVTPAVLSETPIIPTFKRRPLTYDSIVTRSVIVDDANSISEENAHDLDAEPHSIGDSGEDVDYQEFDRSDANRVTRSTRKVKDSRNDISIHTEDTSLYIANAQDLLAAVHQLQLPRFWIQVPTRLTDHLVLGKMSKLTTGSGHLFARSMQFGTDLSVITRLFDSVVPSDCSLSQITFPFTVRQLENHLVSLDKMKRCPGVLKKADVADGSCGIAESGCLVMTAPEERLCCSCTRYHETSRTSQRQTYRLNL